MASSVVEVDAQPLSKHCVQPWERREHACLGISPFNSYFSTARITALVEWAQARFARVHLFVPDQAAAYTLEALGYSPERAAHKAHRQARYLRNKIERALESAGAPAGHDLVLDTQAVEGNERYRALREQARTWFETDPVIRRACLDASHWVLASRTRTTAPTEDQLHAAARYFLAELPFFLDTPGIVGTDSSVFCYHQPPEFLRTLYERKLPCPVHPGQGFATVMTTP
ncbi:MULTISPECIES: tRNA-dependent cyclodipeptide synthase [unclassified Saccharopolyspora]|uniref:tRNA-dependent cyclodipeptide synthase n=1 Tax=Saccharopolyspora TaxID=1835 RepID=UPI00190BBA5F|nr:tRNA-dependent cyclodipeptide synthase [Saccharopolyspora sp. HNM0986]MBK0868809.1 tRNA-dependent cyclodipeptide synthase [Saccharopolyspora sp. HNM0986]